VTSSCAALNFRFFIRHIHKAPQDADLLMISYIKQL